MQRPLATLAGAACGLLALCLIANVVAIRSSPQRTSVVAERSAAGPAGNHQSAAPSEDLRDRRTLLVQRRASALAAQEFGKSLGPLGALKSAEPVIETDFLLNSPSRGIWVTRTEVRVPCEALDRVLGALGDPALGPPRHCERWVEASAELLERYQIATPTPREFVDTYAGDRSVRILVVYTGWKETDDGIQPVEVSTAPVFPRAAFGSSKRRARDHVYAELQLGPHHSEP